MTPTDMTSGVRVTVLPVTGAAADDLVATHGQGHDPGTHRPLRRRQSLVGHCLARAMGAGGPVRGSISHAGPWAGCAISRLGPIGLDLEIAKPGRHWRAIADSWFTPAESRWLDSAGEDGFLALWTLREAWAKAQGLDLAAAMALDGSALPAVMGSQARLILGGKVWTVLHRRLDGVHLALVAQGIDEFGETVIEVLR